MIRFEYHSKAIDRAEKVSVVVPPGGGRRPLLIFLHGHGNDDDGYLYAELFAAIDALGDRAPVVAFPDGGYDSFWHDRDSGDWARLVREEVPRQVARRVGIDRARVAVGGISMGGFGALALARRGGYCAAGGHSPAIWQRPGDTARGAFDDLEDFRRHDLIADPPRGTPLWIDIGEEDPFVPGVRAFGKAAGAEVRVWPGRHDSDYWREHWDEYLRFYAAALEDCVASEPDGQAEEAQDGAG